MCEISCFRCETMNFQCASFCKGTETHLASAYYLCNLLLSQLKRKDKIFHFFLFISGRLNSRGMDYYVNVEDVGYSADICHLVTSQ